MFRNIFSNQKLCFERLIPKYQNENYFTFQNTFPEILFGAINLLILSICSFYLFQSGTRGKTHFPWWCRRWPHPLLTLPTLVSVR